MFFIFVSLFSPPSTLRKGAPVVVSFPHFYQADPKYINAVDGLNPNKEEHETYLDLQPVGFLTGRRNMSGNMSALSASHILFIYGDLKVWLGESLHYVDRLTSF